MATYTKETALYDTGAIATDIQGAEKVAKGYMTNVSNDGVFVHEYSSSDVTPSTAGANGVHISDDVDIIRNGEVVASYGETATLGKTDGTQSYLAMDYHSMQMIDIDGDVFFLVEDLRDKDGYFTDTYTGDGVTKRFRTTVKTTSIISVKVDSVSVTYTIDSVTSEIVLSSAPANGSIIAIQYVPYVSDAKAYTLGKRKPRSSNQYGMYSVVEGKNNSAEAPYAHAEGYDTIAAGQGSHAEGLGTRTNDDYSVALGKYNQPYVSRNAEAFSIGNGTDDNNRSNAVAGDWDGNVYLEGDVYIECNADSTGGTALRPLVVESKSAANATSISAGSYQAINVTVTKTGYTPIGVVGLQPMGSNSGGCATVGCYLSNTTNVVVGVRNVTSSNASYTPKVFVLYKKN